MSILRQSGAVIGLNVKSIPQRFWASFSTILAVALAVAVFLSFLALNNGLRATLAGSGSEDVAIVLRDGSESEINSTVTRDQIRILETGPGVAQVNGAALVSPEIVVVVDGIKRSAGNKANMPLRGLSAAGLAVRPYAKIAEGRMFTPGTNELVVGAGLLREFAGFELGKDVRFGTETFRVVGVFEAPGTVFESELWADANLVQSSFSRGTTFATARVKLNSEAEMAAFKAFVAQDPRLKLGVESEAAYYAKQSEQSGGIIRFLGLPLGVIMAIGALAGALNTMYASVASRAGEIATLRTIGFSGAAAFVGTMAEGLVLALIGGLIGVLICLLFFNGLTTSTLSGGFTQIVFKLQLTPQLVAQGLTMALIIGVIGGVLPGLRAARQSPQIAMGQ